MKKLFVVLCLCLGLGLSGCPQTPRTEAPVPQLPREQPTVKPSTVEPSTPEAKAVVALMTIMDEATGLTKNVGKWTLTPEGTIKAIVIDGQQMSKAAMKLFGEQPDLETLQISNYRELNDEMVTFLKGLKKLKNLSIVNSSGITDAAVKMIVEAFPNLTTLDLSKNTNLKDGALKSISALKELETLAINYCGFSEFGMMDVASLPKLKSLDIRANMTVGNTGLGFLAKIPTLRSLKHRSPAVDDYGLETLTEASNLESLLMQDFNISDSAGESLKKFEKMKELEVFRCQGFGSVGVLVLKGMPLNRLTLRDLPSVDDSAMEVFQELPTLKRLYLNELPSVSDAGLTSLSFLKELEVLDIWEVPITDKTLEVISKLPNVKDLSIRSTQISDSGVGFMLSMPNLTHLTLKDNVDLSDAGKRRLQEKGYKKLDFGSTASSEE